MIRLPWPNQVASSEVTNALEILSFNSALIATGQFNAGNSRAYGTSLSTAGSVIRLSFT